MEKNDQDLKLFFDTYKKYLVQCMEIDFETFLKEYGNLDHLKTTSYSLIPRLFLAAWFARTKDQLTITDDHLKEVVKDIEELLIRKYKEYLLEILRRKKED